MSWITLCRILGAGVYLGVFAAAFTPLPTLLALQLTRPPAPEPAGAIVVLGAGIRPDGTLSDPSLRRAVHKQRYHNVYLSADPEKLRGLPGREEPAGRTPAASAHEQGSARPKVQRR